MLLDAVSLGYPSHFPQKCTDCAKREGRAVILAPGSWRGQSGDQTVAGCSAGVSCADGRRKGGG